ncbi:MAG TPA: COX15/CtaA family protein, partial [Gemmatimonadaceae bacterium]|nr:COX15/CtaA family protein [Gemmatimonadaceae bacterium]
MRLDRFAAYAWAVLVVNFFVVLWGAFVRATGSGAGCGRHWPRCNGAVVPSLEHTAELIEFTHRVTSGIAFVLALALLLWAAVRATGTARWPGLRRLPGTIAAGFGARPWGAELRSATIAMAFMVSEALVGAGLVLFELVADNDSLARAVVLGIHLVNTFFLLGFLALTAWYASGARRPHLKGQDVVAVLSFVTLVGMLALGVTGAITALGDTLFPAGSLTEGVRQDFSSTAHFLLRLRIVHPVLALTVGFVTLLVVVSVHFRRVDPVARRLAKVAMSLFGLQLVLGFVNLFLLAPVWMQLVHLLAA